ncbi:hypothetical protein H9P43_009191 [Blastocladiella emersonii ATCC 22665]|nr:hypothetical protein H9P43_009191 [Blastocladiella emersonii ATCC 22665]
MFADGAPAALAAIARELIRILVAQLEAGNTIRICASYGGKVVSLLNGSEEMDEYSNIGTAEPLFQGSSSDIPYEYCNTAAKFNDTIGRSNEALAKDPTQDLYQFMLSVVVVMGKGESAVSGDPVCSDPFDSLRIAPDLGEAEEPTARPLLQVNTAPPAPHPPSAPAACPLPSDLHHADGFDTWRSRLSPVAASPVSGASDDEATAVASASVSTFPYHWPDHLHHAHAVPPRPLRRTFCLRHGLATPSDDLLDTADARACGCGECPDGGSVLMIEDDERDYFHDSDTDDLAAALHLPPVNQSTVFLAEGHLAHAFEHPAAALPASTDPLLGATAKRSGWRPWLLLTLALSLTGSFWAFDLPAQLNLPLGKRFGFDDDAWQQGLAQSYALYATPNILMPFIAGRLIDHHGPRTVLMALLGFVVLGQTLITCGIRVVNFPLLLLGRFLLGVGGESLAVAQARITCDWYLESELGFALGFHLAFARLGSVLNDLFTAEIEARHNATMASLAALAVCTASLLFGSAACLIDQRRNPADAIESAVAAAATTDAGMMIPDAPLLIASETTPLFLNPPVVESYAAITSTTAQLARTASYTALADEALLLTKEPLAPHIHASSMSIYSNQHTGYPPPRMRRVSTTASLMSTSMMRRQSTLATLERMAGTGLNGRPKPGGARFVLFTFPLAFWMLCVAMVSLYVSCNTFTSISSDFLQTRYGVSSTRAGHLVSLMDIMATTVVPLSGYLFERLPRRGQRAVVVANAVGLAGAFYGLSAVGPESEWFLYLALMGLGTAYAVGASFLWPLLPVLVRDPTTLSTAYGVVTCCVNGTLAVVPSFFAGQIAADPTFGLLMRTFAGMALVGAGAAVMT